MKEQQTATNSLSGYVLIIFYCLFYITKNVLLRRDNITDVRSTHKYLHKNIYIKLIKDVLWNLLCAIL